MAQGLSAWHIVKLREYSDNSDISMRFLLRNGEEDRYKYPVIDVSENRVYIPEARIYLPLNDTSRNLRYDYAKHGADFKSRTLYISDSSVVGRQTDERYASCDKVVMLTPRTDAQPVLSSVVGTIVPSKDGLRDIYMHPSESCGDKEWYANMSQKLVEVVKEAKSY